MKRIGLGTVFISNVQLEKQLLGNDSTATVDGEEVDVQQTHWIRAKRLGYLVYRIGYFFHDKTMDLKFY